MTSGWIRPVAFVPCAKTRQTAGSPSTGHTCALITTCLDEIRAELTTVGVELREDAYLCSNDPAHARPWNPDGVTHQIQIAAAADAAGVELDIKGGRHYTASQFLTGGLTSATPPCASATAGAAQPRCGTTPTRSARWTGGPPYTCTADRQICSAISSALTWPYAEARRNRTIVVTGP